MPMFWKYAKRGFAALVILALTHTLAVAQTPTFAVEGVITDAQQAVLPGATVTITNTATGLTRSTVTDTGGRYVFAAMPTEGKHRIHEIQILTTNGKPLDGKLLK